MTTTNTKTEAELVADNVMLREALVEAIDECNDQRATYCNDPKLCAILASTSDYAEKVVVDEHEWRVCNDIVDGIKGYLATDDPELETAYFDKSEIALARLDSLRGAVKG